MDNNNNNPQKEWPEAIVDVAAIMLIAFIWWLIFKALAG